MSSVAIAPLPTKPEFVGQTGSVLRANLEASLGEKLSSTLLLRERVAPPTITSGVTALDSLTGGLPCGALTEIVGSTSSGRTGVMLAALATATRRQEICALVDASDCFDPVSAAAAGVDLDRLLWIRCNAGGGASGRTEAARTRPHSGFVQNTGFAFGGILEQVLKVTDLLLQGGGFGMVVLDLGDIPVKSVLKVPLTSWFRFRRAVEPTATVLLLIEQEACAKTCASLVLELRSEEVFASSSSADSAFAPGSEHEFSSNHVEPARVPPPLPWPQAELFRTPAADDASENYSTCIPSNPVVSHTSLLRGVRFRAAVLRSWAQRKPPKSAGVHFDLRVAL